MGSNYNGRSPKYQTRRLINPLFTPYQMVGIGKKKNHLLLQKLFLDPSLPSYMFAIPALIIDFTCETLSYNAIQANNLNPPPQVPLVLSHLKTEFTSRLALQRSAENVHIPPPNIIAPSQGEVPFLTSTF